MGLYRFTCRNPVAPTSLGRVNHPTAVADLAESPTDWNDLARYWDRAAAQQQDQEQAQLLPGAGTTTDAMLKLAEEG